MSSETLFRSGGLVGADLGRVDWDATPLGRPEGWPDDLRQVLRLVLTSRFSMWMAWGPDLTFFCNDAYRRDTLGAKYPWALGRPAWEVWGEIWEDIGPRIDLVLREQQSTWDESLHLVLERNGYREETYHTFSYSPLVDAAGNTVGMLCVVAEETDKVVSERRMRTLRDVAAELTAATSECEVFDRLETTLTHDADDLPFTLTYLVDDDGALPRRVATTGITEGLAAALDVAVAVHGARARARRSGGLADGSGGTVIVEMDELPPVRRALSAHFGESMPERIAILPIGAQPEARPIGFLAAGLTPLRPSDDDLLGFTRLLTNQIEAALTTVRALEAARLKAQTLAELDRVKTNFFANVSHEFRTPLTLILGPIEHLRSALAVGQPELVADVEIMHRNALRLSKLVNALLDVSRLQAGKEDPQYERVDLAAFTLDLANLFRPAVEQAGIALEVEVDDLGGAVHVDPSMWEKIVVNLISNALKFTLDGSIGVTLHRRGDHAELRVTDSGVGIPVDELPRLFERFHRVEQTRGRSSEGTGIGLALVAELVELHGGRVSASSELDIGSTFTVTIPMEAASVPAVEMGRSPTREPRREPGGEVASYLAEALRWTPGGGSADGAGEPLEHGAIAPAGDVLVVDDNADMRSYVARLLATRFTVRTASNGREALEEIERSSPDLVVSDVMMPEIDGVELVRRLRDDPIHADLPVVLLTAAIGPEATAQGLDVGADDYLVKPFTAEELLARVSARLAAGQERRQRHALNELAAALAPERNAQDVLGLVHPFLQTWLGADASSLAIAEDEGEAVNLWHVPGYAGGVTERYRTGAVSSPAPVFSAIRTGERIALQDLDEARARFPRSLHDIRESGMSATLITPLRRATGEVHGSLVSSWTAERRFGDADLEFFDRTAAVVGAAMERIRTVDREHRLLHEFQGRLLEIDHRSTVAVVAARYQPSYRGSLVGGDWYDVVTFDDGGLGVSAGDVVGKGLAAATAMSQLRSAVRIAAFTRNSPGDVLAVVDEYARHLPAAECASAVYMRLDPGGELRWNCAGHPPPLLVTAEGVRILGDGRRPLLGCAPPDRPADGRIVPPPCATILLYTDGLVERRGETIDVGIDRLAAAAGERRLLGVSELCEQLLARMTPDGGYRDDVALVAIRVAGEREDHYVDAWHSSPENLPPARGRFAEWLEERGLHPDELTDIGLAFGETLANAFEHGNRFDRSRVVGVEAAVADGQLVVAVSDSGRWTGDSTVSQQSGRGRGFTIINATTERTEVQPGRLGTTTSFRRRLRHRATVEEPQRS